MSPLRLPYVYHTPPTRAAGDGHYYYIMCPYDYEGGPCIPVLPRKKEKKQAGTLSFLIFIAKFGAVAVGSPAETPREIMENITKKLKRAYNPIQLFNPIKTTIMRKNTTFSRSLLLTAALAFSTATLTAQVTAVDSKVTDLAQIVDGGTYAIKCVGRPAKSDDTQYQGWVYENTDRSALFIGGDAETPAVGLGAEYIFTAHVVDATASTFRFEAASGNYIAAASEGGQNAKIVTTVADDGGTATTYYLTLKAVEEIAGEGVWSMQSNANKAFVMKPNNSKTPTEETPAGCLVYNNGNSATLDAWEIYPVNDTQLPEPAIEYPFETSTVSGTEWTGSEHWYTLLTRGTYWAYNAETSKIDLNAATPDLNDDAYLWAIAGNADDGFKIYNKAAGPQVVLTVTDGNAVDMLQGEGTAMLIAEYPGAGSSAMPGGWCISVPGTNQFLNKQDKDNPQDGLSELWIWNSTGAQGEIGSVVTFTDVITAYEALRDEYAAIAGYVGAFSQSDFDASGIKSATTIEAFRAAIAKLEEASKIAPEAGTAYRLTTAARTAGTLGIVLDGDIVVRGTNASTTNASQLWQLEAAGEGYKLKNMNGGLYLSTIKQDGTNTFDATLVSADEAAVWTLEELAMGVFRPRTGEDNSLMMHCAPNGHIVSWNDGLGSASAWNIIPVSTIDVTIGEAGYATINLPVAVQLPEGLTAYTATGETADAVNLTEVEGNVLPAGSPVLLGGKEGTYTLTLLASNSDAALTSNFAGTLLPTAVPDDVNAYILAKKDGDTEAKFYQLAESTPTYAPLYYHLVTRANNAERAGRAIELVAEGSSVIESNNATIGQLWSAPADANNNYQRWAFEADPAGSGKYAMVCKAQPNGSVNPTPTAVSNAGRWNYDNSQKHYGFILNEGGTADGVDYYYITSSDQTTSGWFMNTAGGGQGLSINLWNDINDGSNAGYFSFNVVEYDTDNVIGTDLTLRTIAANKAYYVSTQATGEALSLSFGGPAVGIDQIATPGAEKAQTYYDLQGRRVLYPSNGIFVTEDGQKVFIK